MGHKIMAIGPSGKGKTYAVKGLNPKETFIIAPDMKALPWRGFSKDYKRLTSESGSPDWKNKDCNMVYTDKMDRIVFLVKAINEQRPDVKNIVIDTITFAMVRSMMDRIYEQGYDKFKQFANEVWEIIKLIPHFREDLFVFFLAHDEMETDASGIRINRFKVPAGKLTNEALTPEAKFDVVLYSNMIIHEGKRYYYFETQNNGRNTCKSPEGMFERDIIPNDFGFVKKSYIAWWEGKEYPKVPDNNLEEIIGELANTF